MGILDLPKEVLLMIFSYVPLYNLVFSVQRTCLAWRDLCFHHSLWREVHYYKEFDERLTREELLSVLKQVSRGVKHISFEKAFHLRENHFSFTKFLQCILHESVDMKNISSLKIPSIPNEYLEPLVNKCSGLSAIEVSYEYAYCNDGKFFEAMKKLPHLKEFKITESLEYFADFSSHQTKFNELLADMFGGLLELEVVNIDNASKIYDSTLCVLLSKCKNLRELDLYECNCITNAGFESLPDKSRITSLHLMSASIDDEGMEQICMSCPDLREVSFAGCRYVTDISIIHLCTHCPNLGSLCVSDPETVYNKSNITDGGLGYLFKNYHSLRSLILYNSLDVLNLRVDLLARSCITLIELDVSGCKSITDDTLRIIAVCCTNLQSVNVSKCVRLRGGGVNLLVTSCKRLHTLKVARCRFLEDLNFEAFDRKDTPFDRYIRGRKKASKPSDRPPANQLVHATNVGTSTQSYKTKTIHKSNEESSAGRSTARENFLNALTCSSIPSPRVHSKLRVLNMGMCSRINDRCLRQIATFCPDLRELYITGCYKAKDLGISYIAQGCQQLKVLDMSTGTTKQMRLTDQSLVSIATHCKSLRQLNIMKNDLMTHDGLRYFFDRCPLPITVYLTSKSNEIRKPDILSTDMSVNTPKMVKSQYFYTCRAGYHLGVLLYNSDVDILEGK